MVTAKKSSEGSATGAINVGGSMTNSAAASGHNNKQTIIVSEPASDPAQADVLRALQEIRSALDSLSGPFSNTARVNADAALKAADADAGNKDEIGGALEYALNAAKKGAEFGEIASKLAPLVGIVAKALGGHWTNLTSLLG